MVIARATNPTTGTEYTLRHDLPSLSAFTKRPIGDRWVVTYTDKSSFCPIGRSFCTLEAAQEEFDSRTVASSLTVERDSVGNEIKRPVCPECQTEMTWQGDPCSHDDGIGYYCFADKCLWRGKSLRKIALYNGVSLTVEG